MALTDDRTADVPGGPRRPGRPPSGAARSPAQLQREYRARKKAQGVKETSVSMSIEVVDALKAYVARQNADCSDEPISVGDAVDRIVRAYLLRKR